ncbi:MAG: hypothetical protein AAF125_28390 [Chloroflexota bacterium]
MAVAAKTLGMNTLSFMTAAFLSILVTALIVLYLLRAEIAFVG